MFSRVLILLVKTCFYSIKAFFILFLGFVDILFMSLKATDSIASGTNPTCSGKNIFDAESVE